MPPSGPLERGGQQRFLHRVLATVELPVTANERAEDPRRQLAQQALDVGALSHISVPASSMTGRTSMAQ
jgi:hypothetical protein